LSWLFSRTLLPGVDGAHYDNLEITLKYKVKTQNFKRPGPRFSTHGERLSAWKRRLNAPMLNFSWV